MLNAGSMLRQYKVLKVLGEGGFATTYLAIDINLDKQFAIKEYCPPDFAYRDGATIRIKPGSADNFTWGRDRFLEEARVLARFNHPNIVGVSQIFEENNTAYMVLEYQSGRSLENWLSELKGPPTQEELDLVLKPLLSALSALHRNNILHRDIAPDNLYIRDNGTPVLLDFGSAKEAIAARTKAISAIVKDGYSPPEQYSSRGNSQGPWTDIYALAGTIFYAITKQTPTSSTERLMADDLPSLHDLNTNGFRSSFLSALDWGLRLAPKDRPQTIDDWEKVLFTEAPTAKESSNKTYGDKQSENSTSASPKAISIKALLFAALATTFLLGNFFIYQKLEAEKIQTRSALDGIIKQNETLQTTAELLRQERDRQQELTRKQETARRLEETRQIEEARRIREQEAARQAERQRLEAEETRRRETANQLKSLCTDALATDHEGWDRDPKFSTAVNAVRQRGLSIQDCRETIGLSREFWIYKPGQDIPFHDLRDFFSVSSQQECEKSCEQTSACSGYMFNPYPKEGPACQLKTLTAPSVLTRVTPTYSAVVTAYKKSVERHVFPMNTELKWKYQIVGTIAAQDRTSLENCIAACGKSMTCRAFTWNEGSSICRHYSTISNYVHINQQIKGSRDISGDTP